MGARRDGVDAQTRVVSLFRYRDGQQIERWLYPDDPGAWDAVFTTRVATADPRPGPPTRLARH